MDPIPACERADSVLEFSVMDVESSTGMRSKKSVKNWGAFCERQLRKVLRAVGHAHANCELSLVSAARIAKLNDEFRGLNEPTDVLSFEVPPTFREQGLLGEIVIALPVARAQAREVGLSLEQELTVLLVHGVLHLLGYDHEAGGEPERRMIEREASVLEQVCPKAWVKQTQGRCLKGLILRLESGSI